MQDLNDDQRREIINTRQRYTAFRDVAARVKSLSGSMVWSRTKGTEYLLNSYYRPDGVRRQVSLGPRSPETERIKDTFERNRAAATDEFKHLEPILRRQTAVNRALGLGRVPRLPARIIRAIDEAGLLGKGIRVVGTHALYAYEAAAGVVFDAGILTTEDVDLLYDSRIGIRFVVEEDVPVASLLKLLTRVDHSFTRSRQSYRAVNRDGYNVDLIRPLRDPPWINEKERLGDDNDDLEAVAIEGLVWLENAPLFDTIAIDETGAPLRLAVCDPRVFAAHKLWLSEQPGRDPLKRRRDAHQAQAVAKLVMEHLPHLHMTSAQLKMLPKSVFEAAKTLFI
jgi:hypothetical protein